MNVFDCIFNRRSVYAYKKEPIDDKLIGVMLHAAIHAPSAGNIQEWHFCVVKDQKQKEKLYEAALRQNVVREVPVVIVVCVDLEKANLRYGKRGESLYGIQDTANATMIMLLAAHALGLASVWIGAFDEDAVSHILDLPSNIRPIAIVPIGYAAEEPEKPGRVPFESLTSVNSYGKKYDIAYAVQPEPGKEIKFKPIGTYLEEIFKKREGEKKQKKPKKKLTFAEFLKRLSK